MGKRFVDLMTVTFTGEIYRSGNLWMLYQELMLDKENVILYVKDYKNVNSAFQDQTYLWL